MKSQPQAVDVMEMVYKNKLYVSVTNYSLNNNKFVSYFLEESAF